MNLHNSLAFVPRVQTPSGFGTRYIEARELFRTSRIRTIARLWLKIASEGFVPFPVFFGALVLELGLIDFGVPTHGYPEASVVVVLLIWGMFSLWLITEHLREFERAMMEYFQKRAELFPIFLNARSQSEGALTDEIARYNELVRELTEHMTIWATGRDVRDSTLNMLEMRLASARKEIGLLLKIQEESPHCAVGTGHLKRLLTSADRLADYWIVNRLSWFTT